MLYPSPRAAPPLLCEPRRPRRLCCPWQAPVRCGAKPSHPIAQCGSGAQAFVPQPARAAPRDRIPAQKRPLPPLRSPALRCCPWAPNSITPRPPITPQPCRPSATEIPASFEASRGRWNLCLSPHSAPQSPRRSRSHAACRSQPHPTSADERDRIRTAARWCVRRRERVATAVLGLRGDRRAPQPLQGSTFPARIAPPIASCVSAASFTLPSFLPLPFLSFSFFFPSLSFSLSLSLSFSFSPFPSPSSFPSPFSFPPSPPSSPSPSSLFLPPLLPSPLLSSFLGGGGDPSPARGGEEGEARELGWRRLGVDSRRGRKLPGTKALWDESVVGRKLRGTKASARNPRPQGVRPYRLRRGIPIVLSGWIQCILH